MTYTMLRVVPAAAHPFPQGFICQVMPLVSNIPTAFGSGLLLVIDAVTSVSPGLTETEPVHSNVADPKVARPFTATVSLPPQAAVVTLNFALSEMDRLLDKISKHGLASLTSKERESLERARAKLLEQDDK